MREPAELQRPWRDLLRLPDEPRQRSRRSRRRRRSASWGERLSALAGSPSGVSRDVAGASLPSTRPSAPALGALALGVVAAGLLLVWLRMDSVRLRYRLADAHQHERELLETGGRLTLEVEQLRDPRRLADRARELGLVRPHRVLTLSSAEDAAP